LKCLTQSPSASADADLAETPGPTHQKRLHSRIIAETLGQWLHICLGKMIVRRSIKRQASHYSREHTTSVHFCISPSVCGLIPPDDSCIPYISVSNLIQTKTSPIRNGLNEIVKPSPQNNFFKSMDEEPETTQHCR
jgi:hypothetical protein